MAVQRLANGPILIWSATTLLSLGLGIVLALALAPLQYLWAVPFALGLVSLQFLRASSVRSGAWIGWLFGLGYFGFGMSWIVEPFQVDPDRHAWMAPFALFFLAGGLALFWAVAFGVAARVSLSSLRVLALIVAWSLAEFGRAYLFSGLPWAAFGQFWIDSPAAVLLPWIGPHGLAFLTLATVLPLGLLPRSPVLTGIPPLLALFAMVLLPSPADPVLTQKVVRLVQPNAPQDQKWRPDYRWGFVRRQLGYTSAMPRPDLVVWPETAVPQLLNYADETLAAIANAADGVPVITGIQRSEGLRYFNSLLVLDEQGATNQIYDKTHLVPFGEYVPFGDFLARFGIAGFASQAGSGYTSGQGAQILDLTIGKALPLICYEAVFPQLVNKAPERPDMLVQITNDAWFGIYSGPYQHLVQAQMRAAEQGLPMIRVANTGVSAMIDGHGRIRESLPLGEAGFVDAVLPQPLPPTLYSRVGDLPVFLFLLLLAGFVGWRHRFIAIRT
ncbi:apolipoprotein N-acyltransferase [Parasedimentitalea maritima]|uniref:Apolipoprotein N-acyltransferase n=1 Tax=Parasedimentitalea maritima TaxID=2578117 RepID=A0ABY2V158_9RHOB|nr:apolipoprotein N-acyltransferase [Zongyanglinia marina]